MHKKVLIIFPKALYDKEWCYAQFSHLNILALYSFLKENRIPVDVLDMHIECPFLLDETVDQYRDKVKDLLRKYDFDIVAISCYSSLTYLSSVMVAKICRELNKNCKIVVGGYHPTACPEDFTYEDRLFDYVVRGEGETTLLEICNGHYQNENGYPCIINGTPRDLSRGVYLDWKGFKYSKPNSFVQISFNRGCANNCSFCSESTRRYVKREYPVDLALKDFKRVINEMNPSEIQIQDPTFEVHTPWGNEFLSRLIKEGFKKPIWCMVRIDLLRKQDIDLLSKLNIFLFVGIESYSKKILTAMNKTKNPDFYLKKIEENLTYLNEKNILTNFALLFNHPGETQETVDETFSFLERFYSRLSQTSILLSHATDYFYIPGTYISENLQYFEKEFGTVIKYKHWWREYAPHLPLAVDNIPSRSLKRRIMWRDRLEKFRVDFIIPRLTKEARLFTFWWEKGYNYTPHKVFNKDYARV